MEKEIENPSPGYAKHWKGLHLSRVGFCEEELHFLFMLPLLLCNLFQLISNSIIISNYIQIYPNHHLCIEMNCLLFLAVQASAAVTPKSGVFVRSEMSKV